AFTTRCRPTAVDSGPFAVPDALEHREPRLLRHLKLKGKLVPNRNDGNARRIAWTFREAERMRDEGHHEHDRRTRRHRAQPGCSRAPTSRPRRTKAPNPS